VTRSNQQKVD